MAMRNQPAGARRALTREDIEQRGLTVARNSGDADNLARAEREGHTLDSEPPLVILNGGRPRTSKHNLGARIRRCDRTGGRTTSPIIIRAMSLLERSATLPAPSKSPVPQHRHRVGEGADFTELVRNHQDGDFPAHRHRPKEAEHLVGFIRGHYRRGFVENRAALIKVELPEDFKLLFLACGEAVDRFVKGARNGILSRKAEAWISRRPS